MNKRRNMIYKYIMKVKRCKCHTVCICGNQTHKSLDDIIMTIESEKCNDSAHSSPFILPKGKKTTIVVKPCHHSPVHHLKPHPPKPCKPVCHSTTESSSSTDTIQSPCAKSSESSSESSDSTTESSSSESSDSTTESSSSESSDSTSESSSSESSDSTVELPKPQPIKREILLHTKGFKHTTDYKVSNYDTYREYVKRMLHHDTREIENIGINPASGMKLVDPNCKFTKSACLPTPTTYTPQPFPEWGSIDSMGQLAEIYMMSWLRDISFDDFTNTSHPQYSLITQCCTMLNTLMGSQSQYTPILPATPANLFRGQTKGDKLGCYISQFMLYRPRWNLNTSVLLTIPAFQPHMDNIHHYYTDKFYNIPMKGAADIVHTNTTRRTEYGLTATEFLNIEDGQYANHTYPGSFKPFLTNKRHILTPRDLTTIVHADYPCELAMRAAEILLSYRCPLNKHNPYRMNILSGETGPFVLFSGAELYNLIGEVTREALRLVWYYKYTNFTARPEEIAGKIHYEANNILEHAEIQTMLNNVAFRNILNEHKTQNAKQVPISSSYHTLMPLVYPEGSPTHPSCPAGHAVAGAAACALMKAYFDEDYLVRNMFPVVCVKSSDYYSVASGVTTYDHDSATTAVVNLATGDENIITVGNELDKLTSNIAMGRNMAGIHYRRDAETSFMLGEQLAINMLQRKLNEWKTPKELYYQFTLRDGRSVKVTRKHISYN